MKKNIIIFCTVLTTLSLMAFGVIKWTDPETDQLEIKTTKVVTSDSQVKEKIKVGTFSDFIYDVGPRFGPIKKGDLDKARSIDAFLDEEQMLAMVSLKSVSVIIIKDDKQSDIRETGYTKELTSAQLKLIHSSDYSTNFLIRMEYQQKNKETGKLEDSYSTPHMTIVPERQAVYVNGKDSLIEYLKEYSEAVRVNVESEKLKPAKLFFTVTKNGAIKNVKLDRSSNYPSLDKRMIELINEAPGYWEPAQNSKGEKVDQELVVSFGLIGC